MWPKSQFSFHTKKEGQKIICGACYKMKLQCLLLKNINDFKVVTANNPTKCKTLLSVGSCVTTAHVTCP